MGHPVAVAGAGMTEKVQVAAHPFLVQVDLVSQPVS